MFSPDDRRTKSVMEPREAYTRIAKFEKADYIPHVDAGIFPRTIESWYDEGLPRDVPLDEFFGWDNVELHRGVNFGPIPGYYDPDEHLPQTDEWAQGRDAWGRLVRYHKKTDADDDWAEAAYEVVEGAFESVDKWEPIRDDFEPRIQERYGKDWDQKVQAWKGHTNPLVLEVPSMIGGLKEKMGFENYCYKLYEAPDMIEEIMEKQTQLALEICDKAIDDVDFDFIWFWEDIGFRNGPILGPDVFERIATPRYKRISDWYKSRGGEIVAMDSDGDIRPLIPGWIKGGINHIWPLEVFADMDCVALRAEYGQDFSIRGGIDKFCVQQGRDAIDRELERVAPVVEEGGFIPGLDHGLPHASFDDYCYYQEQKHKILGTRPRPREEIRAEKEHRAKILETV